MASGADSVERFKTLIQPIRDLASSWDVDIAEELGDYLEELESLEISLEAGSSTNLNFAQAALLIQGSTAVYSKKVEYLHQLVLQALELFSTNKGKSSQNQVSRKNAASTSFLDDDRLLFGSDPTFLLLDDIIEEGSNIDLEMPGPTSKPTDNRRRSSGRHSISGDISKSSMLLMHSILQEDHGGGNLKLSSCDVDASGALLIGGVQSLAGGADCNVSTNGPQRQDDAAKAAISSPDVVDNSVGGDWGGDADDYGGEMGGAPDDTDTTPFHDAAPTKGHEALSADRGFNKLDQAVGNVQNEPHTAAKAIHPLRKNNRTGLALLDPHEVTTGSKPFHKSRSYRIPPALKSINSMRNAQRRSHKSLLSVEGLTPADVFANLITGKVPLNGLAHMHFQWITNEKKKRLRQRKREERLRAGEIDDAFFVYRDPADDFNPLGGNGRDYPYAGDEGGNGMPPRGGEDDDDDIGDFMQDEDDYDFNGGDGSQAFTFAGSLEEAGAGGGGVVRYWDDSADFNAAGAGAGVGVGSAEGVSTGDNDDDDDRDVDAGEIEHMLSLRPLNPYAAMLHEEEELARRVEDVLNEGLSQSNSTSSYETLCRKHIENFMKGAEEYARETQLSRRVADWTRRLEPLLRQQEVAPMFDIHEYSGRVISRLGDLLRLDPAARHRIARTRLSLPGGARSSEGDPSEGGGGSEGAESKCDDDWTSVGFEEVVHGQSSEEVCRVFLACLQLANMGNVMVVPPLTAEDKAHVSPTGIGASDPGDMMVAATDGTAPAKQKRGGKARNGGREEVAQGQRQGKGHAGDHPNAEAAATLISRRLVEPFSLRLLSDQRRQDIENFRAPSLFDPLTAVKMLGEDAASESSQMSTYAAKLGKGKDKGSRVVGKGRPKGRA